MIPHVIFGRPTSAAVALVLMAAGHARGWPILRGGAQTLSDILARHLQSLGGDIETEHEVTSLPETDLVLADLTPRQLVRIAGSSLPARFQKRLERINMAPALSRSTTLSTLPFLGELENAHGPQPFTLEEPSKRSLPPNAHSRLIRHLFFWVSLRFLIPAGP
jgi:phytoene dehydrogenase-like protein